MTMIESKTLSIIQVGIKGLSSLLFCALLLTALNQTLPEISMQDYRELLIIMGLTTVALCGMFCFNATIRLTVADLLGTSLLILVVFNYVYISDTPNSVRIIRVAMMTTLYIDLRIIASFFLSVTEWLLGALFLTGILQSITVLMQVLGFTSSNHVLFTVTGTFFNPGPLGGYLATIGAVSIVYALTKYSSVANVADSWRRVIQVSRKRLWLLLYVLSVCAASCTIVILPATFSRSSWLALVAALITYGWFHFKPHVHYSMRNMIRSLLWGMIPLLLVGGILYAFKVNSANGRFFMWYISSRIIFAHPLAGVGIGAFRGVYTESQGKYFAAHPNSPFIQVADVPEYGFNEYLQLGAEIGCIGLLLFLLLLVVAFRGLARQCLPMACGMISLSVFAFSSYPFSILPLLTLLTLFIGLGASNSPLLCMLTKGNIILVLLLSLGGLGALGQYSVHKIEATKLHQQISYTSYHSGAYQTVVDESQKLYPYMKDNPVFMFEYGRSLHKLGKHSKSNAVLFEGVKAGGDPMFYNLIGQNYKALGDWNSAEYAYKKAIQEVPNRLYPRYLLFKLYCEMGNKEMARSCAEEVIRFSVKIESPATKEMKKHAFDYLSNSAMN